jgi:hydrogenase maturation protease
MPPVKAAPDVLLVGIGNFYRGDDAIGRIVARQIKLRKLPHLWALEHEGEGTSLMELWKDVARVIVVDAVSSCDVPGKIHRFDAHLQPLPAQVFSISTHAFGLVEAVELARVLKQLPDCLIVFGIEGNQFKIGAQLSLLVREAIPKVIECVLGEARMTVKSDPTDREQRI